MQPNREYYFEPRQSDRRKRSNGKRRVFQVNEMTEMHHEIARRILLGQKNVDIANELNCHAQTVSNVRNSPVVQNKLKTMNDKRDDGAVNFIEEINKRVGKALEILDEALYDETTEIPLSMRLKEANSLLDRKEKIEGYGQRHMHAHAYLTGDDIENLKKRAFEVGVQSGVVSSSERSEPLTEVANSEPSPGKQNVEDVEYEITEVKSET